MRILISSPPGLGHFFPLVPLAWAARSDGHEVLVASTGRALQAAAEAGLSAVEAAPGEDIEGIFRSFGKKQRDKALKRGDTAADDPMLAGVELFSDVSTSMATGTIHAARAWCPDLILHPPLHVAGPLAAALLQVPAVCISSELSIPRTVLDALEQRMRPTFERHGWWNELPKPAAVLDCCPPSMREGGGDLGWPLRYVPYNGGACLDEWLLEPSPRPRVCVTLGSVLPRMLGVIPARGVVEALRDFDVEAVFALDGADTSILHPLPANSRAVGWVPLSALLPTCAAVVHHGGTGSTLNALSAGVPQLARPLIANSFFNSSVIDERGVGLTEDPWRTQPAKTADALRRLLDDPAIRGAAEDVRREMAAQPSPAALIPRLVELAC